MKFALIVSLLFGAYRGTAAQSVFNDTKFKVFNVYDYAEYTANIPTSVVSQFRNDELGGGFIDGDDLYVVAGAMDRSSKLIRVPLTRNVTTGKIIDMHFANATEVLAVSGLDNGFQNQNAAGPGNQVFYSIAPLYTITGHEEYYPYEVHHGTFDSAAKSFSFVHNITYGTWTGLNISDPSRPIYGFTGLLGIGFSPSANNLDPGTNYGYMVGTAPYGFWQVGLAGTAAAYTPVAANTRKLCSLEAEFARGMAFIPSGSLKDSVMINSFDDSEVKILELDYSTPDAATGTTGLCIDSTSGLPELGTASPKIETFATGIDGAWGLFFDPQTNDFFTNTFEGSNQIVHFEGFPPGVDVQNVIQAIQTSIQIIGSAILGIRRRQLEVLTPEEEEEELGLRGRRRAQLFTTKSSACPKTTKSTKTTKGSDCNTGPVETAIDAVVLTASVQAALSSLTSATNPVAAINQLAATITAPLGTTFQNPSFATGVISGQAPPAFFANLDAVAAAINSITTSTVYLGLSQVNRDTVDQELAKINELLDILRNVVEV